MVWVGPGGSARESRKVPTLDVVSIGPSIYGAHSIQEAVSIRSVDKFYHLLVAVLGDLAANKPK